MNVSRETSELLEAYVALIRKWTRKINLVAPSTLETIWDRHIADSAQVYDLAPPEAVTWADFGTGAGLPGLVAAILAKRDRPDLIVTLVESDKRKAIFCRTVVRELGLNAEVVAERIENLPPLMADVVSARALAPLDRLLDLTAPHLAPGGIALFPKGADHQSEVDAARATWHFHLDTPASRTDSRAVILKIKDISRA